MPDKSHNSETCPCVVCQRHRGEKFEVSPATRKKIGDFSRGKTFEERFGIAKAKEMKENLSCIHSGRVIPQTTREQISKKLIGRKRPKETIEKIRKKATGRKMSPEAIEKNRQGQLGKVLSEVTKQKIKKAMLGKPVLEETREKIRKKLLKRAAVLKRIKYTQQMIDAYETRLGELEMQLSDRDKTNRMKNDKIYIPYHPERNRKEREKMMKKFCARGWEYLDARRIWDAPFNRWLYFWILVRK